MSDIREELSALITRPDDVDSWAVEATQGHIRRAIMEIDRLRARIAELEAENEKQGTIISTLRQQARKRYEQVAELEAKLTALVEIDGSVQQAAFHFHYDPDHTGFCIECGADLDKPAV